MASTVLYIDQPLTSKLVLMKKFFILLLLVSFLHVLNAQPTSNYYREPSIVGVRIGGNYSVINDLETTILSEAFFTDYTLKPEYQKGFTAGLFFNHRFPQASMISAQLEMMYSRQPSMLRFSNTLTDFNYDMEFRYSYINFAFLAKISGDYETGTEGLGLSAGFQVGMNIEPNAIYYRSYGSGRLPAFGSDMEQEQQLRNVLKGKTNAGFLVDIGYEFSGFPLILNARYHKGLSDVVETQPNSYNFIANKNTNDYFHVGLAVYLQ
jgi:hypothetical protein